MEKPLTHNHQNYQKRLDFIRDEVCTRFNLENPEIATVAYNPDGRFKANNFIYLITLVEPRESGRLVGVGVEAVQACCVKVPDDATKFILRLTNAHAEGVNNSNRVENEVGTMYLAAKALAHIEPRVVPSVYGWATASSENSQGWILEEWMPGVDVDTEFDDLSPPKQQEIFAQMAEILHSLQRYQLPPSVADFGGLTINSEGEIVSATMTTVAGGPWSSLELSFKEKMRLALMVADKNPCIEGWHANGVRQRLENFMAKGVDAAFLHLQSKQDKIIIHSDFTTNNLLFDSTANQITALLDYDFSCISHPSVEFLRSFHTTSGLFPGWTGNEDEEMSALREAQLHGFPSPLPQLTSPRGVQWEQAKAWDDELAKFGALRPSTIEGIESIADVDALSEAILPFHVTNADMLKLQSEEDVRTKREMGEKCLIAMLDRLGF